MSTSPSKIKILDVLVNKYGTTQLIKFLKMVHPHLSRPQARMNRKYLKYTRFGTSFEEPKTPPYKFQPPLSMTPTGLRKATSWSTPKRAYILENSTVGETPEKDIFPTESVLSRGQERDRLRRMMGAGINTHTTNTQDRLQQVASKLYDIKHLQAASSQIPPPLGHEAWLEPPLSPDDPGRQSLGWSSAVRERDLWPNTTKRRKTGFGTPPRQIQSPVSKRLPPTPPPKRKPRQQSRVSPKKTSPRKMAPWQIRKQSGYISPKVSPTTQRRVLGVVKGQSPNWKYASVHGLENAAHRASLKRAKLDIFGKDPNTTDTGDRLSQVLSRLNEEKGTFSKPDYSQNPPSSSSSSGTPATVIGEGWY